MKLHVDKAMFHYELLNPEFSQYIFNTDTFVEIHLKFLIQQHY